jgi:hypothetical protein
MVVLSLFEEPVAVARHILGGIEIEGGRFLLLLL